MQHLHAIQGEGDPMENLSEAFKKNPEAFRVFMAGVASEALRHAGVGGGAPALQTPEIPTFGEIFAIYRRTAAITPGSLKNNILAMKLMLRDVEGPSVDPESLRIDLLNARLIPRFQEAFVRRRVPNCDSNDPRTREARDRALRSSRSVINQARCVFTTRGHLDMLERYQSEGLYIPSGVNEFMKCRLRGDKWRTEYKVPDDDVIERVFDEIELMRADRDVYLAFWLAVGAGLRKSEIHYCQWSDFVERNGRLWIAGELIGKNRKRVEVGLQKRAADAIKPYRKSEGWVIEARSDRPFRRLNAWMKRLGWADNRKEPGKVMHELRALVGSRMYLKNPVAARMFLRHSSITITERFYLRFKTLQDPIDVI